jgi:integrase
MATLVQRGKRVWRLQFLVYGRRHSLTYSGPRAEAEELRGHIERLIGCQKAGIKPGADLVGWASRVDPAIRRQLYDAGLVLVQPEGNTIGELVNYAEGRFPDLAERTKINYAQVHRNLAEFFGAARRIGDITHGDCEDFKRWLAKRGLGSASIAKNMKHSRQMFGWAVQREWISRNPFAGIKTPVKIDPERRHFVERESMDRLIAAVPDLETKLILALARYGGLRIGSEVRTLRWADVDLKAWTMRIRSPKTKSSRVCPIFVELQPHFKALRKAAPLEADLVCPGFCRSSDAAFRNRVFPWFTKAGVEPWRDLWLNCRRSRATEVVEQFGPRAEADWIGHGADISLRHYQMTLQAKVDEAVGRARPKFKVIG